MPDPMDVDVSESWRTELELAALRRDVDVKAAYSEYLERLLLRSQEAEAWLRGEITRLSQGLLCAQAQARAERAAAEQWRALSTRRDAELEMIRARVLALETDCAALQARLRLADNAAAEMKTLLEVERGRTGNRIVRRLAHGLRRFPRMLNAIRHLIDKGLGPA